MKLSTFLLLAAVSGAWGQGVGIDIGKPAVPKPLYCETEPKTFEPCFDKPIDGEMRYEPYIWYSGEWHPLSLLEKPEPASEGKSDHPPLATCWNDNAMNLHCSDFPEPEPMVDIPAIKRKPYLATRFRKCGPNETSTGGPDACSENYLVSDEWTCKKGGGRILLEDVDHGWHCLKFPKKLVAF